MELTTKLVDQNETYKNTEAARDPSEFPDKLRILFIAYRYKVVFGGRGGAKSWGFARALLLLGVNTKLRILCTREVQRSIKDSVHKLLNDQIQILGLGKKYQVLDQEIRGTNGTEFVFSGLATHTVESIKSFEGCDIVWIEEGQFISKRSWDILIPTIRKERFTSSALQRVTDLIKTRPHSAEKLFVETLNDYDRALQAIEDVLDGNTTADVKKVAVDPSEIWISFNPELDTDPTYVRFVKKPPPDAKVVKMNWRDNPWFNKVLNNERLYCKENDPKGYSNIWEGMCKPAVEGAIFYDEISKADIENRITNVPYDPMLKVHVIIDLGFNDAMSISCVQKQSSEVRIIKYIEDSHRDLASYSAELRELNWNWGKVWLPFVDGFSRGSAGQWSAKKIMKKLGWSVAAKSDVANVAVETGIKVTRLVFSRMYFDQTNCERLLECAKRYCRNINQQTGEAGSPKHDEWSHGGDNLRYISTNIDSMTNADDFVPMPYVASYQPLDTGAGY